MTFKSNETRKKLVTLVNCKYLSNARVGEYHNHSTFFLKCSLEPDLFSVDSFFVANDARLTFEY